MVLLRSLSFSKQLAVAGGAFLATVSTGTPLAAGPSSRGARARAEAIEVENEVADTPLEAADWRYAQRATPSPEIPVGAYLKAHRSWTALLDRAIWPFATADGTIAQLGGPIGGTWTLIGPGPVDNGGGGGLGSGRTTAIVLDPTNVNVVYAGFADAGVWKSTDGGTSWKVLTDSQPSLAVGAIILDPQNSSTIFVGTGEGNFAADSFYGRGILKSTDGGTTWTQLGADTFDSLSIPHMFIDASGAIYVAAAQGSAGSGLGCNSASAVVARRGLYKSTDAGAHFTQIISGRNVSDFEINAGSNPVTGIVAAYKEGSFHFQETAGGMATVTPIAGLPTATDVPAVTRTEFGRSRSNPSVIYAGVGFDTMPGTSALFVSMNGGDAWTRVPGIPNYCADQCFYDNVVEVDPTEPGTVYLGGMVTAVARVTGATGAAPVTTTLSRGLHSDTHVILVDPADPTHLWTGSDGGISFSTNSGTTWTQRNAGLSTLQFYNLCVDPNDETLVFGCLQDNGIVQPNAVGSMTWRNIHGGDGMSCANNLGDPVVANRYLVTSIQYAALARKATAAGAYQENIFGPGQDRVNFIAPLANDVNAPLNVYVGTYRVYKSTTGGTSGSFRSVSPDLTTGAAMLICANNKMRPDVLGAIAAASQRVYTGSFSGKVFTSPDGGTTWNDVTKAPLPPRYVSSFAVDPANPSDVYVAFSGFSTVTPAAPGHIFHSSDAGGTWTRADTNLDIDLPINALARNPAATNVLYAGTDLGVVGTRDAGATWNAIGTGLPHVAVFSLQFHAKAGKLFASTHGRSAWSLTLGPSLVASPAALVFYARPGQTPAAQTVTVSNADTAASTLQFNAAPTGATWLTVTPTSGAAVGGAAPGIPLSVSVSTAGLGLGDYMGSLSLSAPGSDPPTVTVPVQLHISETGLPPSDAGSGGATDAGVDGSTGGSGGSASGPDAATGSGGATGMGGAQGASGGSSGVGGNGNPAGPGVAGDDGGCGCRIAQKEGTSRPLFMAIFVALASLASARRRR